MYAIFLCRLRWPFVQDGKESSESKKQNVNMGAHDLRVDIAIIILS